MNTKRVFSIYIFSPIIILSILFFFLLLDKNPITIRQEHRTLLSHSLHNAIQSAFLTGKNMHPDWKQLVFTEKDIASAINFVLFRKKIEGSANFSIKENKVYVLISFQIFLQRYLNIQLVTEDIWPDIHFKYVKIGKLEISPSLSSWIVKKLIRVGPLTHYHYLVELFIEDVYIKDSFLIVHFNLKKNVSNKLSSLNTELERIDKNRISIYQTKLDEVVSHPNIKRFIRLTTLLQPMFLLAKTRSESGQSPIEENRALILVLAAYVNEKNLSILSLTTTTPILRKVLLSRREDTAKHFIGSASLAMTGQGALTDVMGLAKEMNDSHGGSGFSFADLAADQAGALFGRLAVRNEESARKVQNIMSQSTEESQFMPPINDLPEGLQLPEFESRFIAIQSNEFETMKNNIHDRLESLPLYRTH